MQRVKRDADALAESFLSIQGQRDNKEHQAAGHRKEEPDQFDHGPQPPVHSGRRRRDLRVGPVFLVAHDTDPTLGLFF